MQPRPVPRQVVKAQSADQKSTMSSVSSASLKTAEKQSMSRKRPAEGDSEVVEGASKAPVPEVRVGPPSKKVKLEKGFVLSYQNQN